MKKLITVVLCFLGLVKGYTQHLYPIDGGWIKQNGKSIELSYADYTYHAVNGVAIFISKGKFGGITLDGSVLINPTYIALTNFRDDIAFAKTQNGWMAINSQGQELFKIVANYVYELKEGLARFQLGNRFGFINSKGAIVIPPTYAGAYDFNEGKARVYSNGKWGFIDVSGKMVISASFDYVADFSEGLAPFMKKVGKEEHWGYMDELGKVKIPAQLGYGFPFKEGYAVYRRGAYRGGQLSLIDSNGKVVLELPYVDAVWSGNGLINVCRKVQEHMRWGYVSITGEEVIPFEFDHKGEFVNGLARVYRNGKMCYINEKGEVIWEKK
jgi:hypothetical protein